MEHMIKHSRSQSLIDFACAFALKAHGDQRRKYTFEPYISHPIAVAEMVATVTGDCEMIAAAFLHDVIEDTSTTYEDICNAGFGWSIADMVSDLSDKSRTEDGNRAARKAIDRSALANADPRVKTIKLADLIHNSESILRHDPNFAKVFIKEMDLLLDVLKDGNCKLHSKASKIVELF